jgi:Tfp pilus assembly protein PilN
MINLLPPNERAQLRAARANTLLLRYNIIMVGVAIFMVLALATVYFYLSSAKAHADSVVADNNTRVSSYSQVSTQADAFRSSLANAKSILDKEIFYSKTILLLAHQLPSGVVIDTLNLAPTTFGTPTTLALRAKDRMAVLAAKDSLQKSPLFTDVHLISVTSPSGSSGSSAYPVTASLSVVISKDAAK